MKRGQERHLCVCATHCDAGQLLPSLRDNGTCLDEDGLKVSEGCALGCLLVSTAGKPAFPILSPPSPASGCHQHQSQNKTQAQAAENWGQGEKLCHRESEVTSLWCLRGCTHSPASPFLAEKPLISQRLHSCTWQWRRQVFTSHRPLCKRKARVEGTPRVWCLCHSIILLPGTQDTPPVLPLPAIHRDLGRCSIIPRDLG